jgi:hypothetical protein
MVYGVLCHCREVISAVHGAYRMMVMLTQCVARLAVCWLLSAATYVPSTDAASFRGKTFMTDDVTESR